MIKEHNYKVDESDKRTLQHLWVKVVDPAEVKPRVDECAV